MLNVKKSLYDDIVAYCKLNEIKNVEEFCNKLLEKAFTAEKYGSKPTVTKAKKVEPKQEAKPEVVETKEVVEIKIEKKVEEKDDYYEKF